MNPEQGFVVIGERIAVKRLVFFVRALFRVFQIQRLRVVYGLVRLFLVAFLVLFALFDALCVQVYGIRHKRAILSEQRTNRIFVQEFFFFVGDMQHDFRTSAAFFRLADFISSVAVRFPVNRGRSLVALRENFHVACHHVRRIESESEMPDDSVAGSLFVFLQEIFRARKRNLRDVLFNFFFRHADAVIFDGQRFRRFVGSYVDSVVFRGIVCGLYFTHFHKFLVFRNRIHAVRNNFAKEYILIGIQPLFDNRHHIFAGNTDFSLFFVFHLFVFTHFRSLLPSVRTPFSVDSADNFYRVYINAKTRF